MQLFKSKNGRVAEKPHKNGKGHGASPGIGSAAGLGPDGKVYRPSDKEPFMNERQREYFRLKLLDWRENILKEARETLQHLQDESQNHPDLADRASSETDRAIELRARDRQRKLIAKIDAALQRIEDGTYGYCEETGEPITLKRLEARPIATLSIEAQERHERRERVYRDDY
jgi:DnaK suppressor protein